MLEREHLEQLVDIIGSYLEENEHPQTPVVDYVKADTLRNHESLGLNEQGLTEGELWETVKTYLDNSVRTAHSRFNNQLYAGINPISFIGEVVAAISNTSMATYEIAPMATLMERELVDKINNLIGFKTAENEGEGIMVTGGSNAILIAMLSARNKHVEGVKQKGLAQNNLVAFVSDQGHYSSGKAMNVLGMGTDNLVKVASDATGKMIPAALEEAIVKVKSVGKEPFFVVATAGTTVFGAFDPIRDMAAICDKHNIFLHVDGAWGGSAMLSDQYRHLLDGIELADSYGWDAHKAMGAGVIASFVTFKEKGTLYDTNSGGGSKYIFHNYENEAYDTGKESIQCGRRVDSLKVWLAWKYYGDKGYAGLYEGMMEKAQYLKDKVVNHPKFELITEPQYLNVCFRYLPDEEEVDFNEFNYELRTKLVQSGTFLVNFSRLADDTIFFRQIIANPEISYKDIDDLLLTLLSLAEEMESVRT